jgi:ribosomal protein S18 acetylase RimI-like enzyme
MISKINFRAAIKADCRAIASLQSIASDGVEDYVWAKQALPGEATLDVGQRRYERTDSSFSYLNVIVSENDEEIAGMMCAFPIHIDPNYVEKDPVLSPYSKLEEDNSYYICGVALFPTYRGQGIGKKFMRIAEEHAQEKDFKKLSLIVFEQNAGAKRLYDNLGYREVAREPIVPHRLIRCTGDALLMVKDIS